MDVSKTPRALALVSAAYVLTQREELRGIMDEAAGMEFFLDAVRLCPATDLTHSGTADLVALRAEWAMENKAYLAAMLGDGYMTRDHFESRRRQWNQAKFT